MRIFPTRVFERVFVEDKNPGVKTKRYKRFFDYNKMVKPDAFNSMVDYRNLFHSFLVDASRDTWNNMVKLSWLISNFSYKGRYNKIYSMPGGGSIGSFFNVWIRENVGINYTFLSNSFTYTSLVTYFEEFIPDFYKDNPFSNPQRYIFPYKFIFRLLIHQVHHRVPQYHQGTSHSIYLPYHHWHIKLRRSHHSFLLQAMAVIQPLFVHHRG